MPWMAKPLSMWTCCPATVSCFIPMESLTFSMANGEMLGVEGVQNLSARRLCCLSSNMKQGILDRVAAWREGPASDDVSLVLVDVH